MPDKIKGCGFCLFGETVWFDTGEYIGIDNDDNIIAGMPFCNPTIKKLIKYCPWCGTNLSTIPKSLADDNIELIKSE